MFGKNALGFLVSAGSVGAIFLAQKVSEQIENLKSENHELKNQLVELKLENERLKKPLSLQDLERKLAVALIEEEDEENRMKRIKVAARNLDILREAMLNPKPGNGAGKMAER
jgi:regulator of replication initiation timing